jgi:hypothetical protein
MELCCCEFFMGIVLRSQAQICAVPEQGTRRLEQSSHTVAISPSLLVAVQQVAMDDAYFPGYHFMTLG